MEPENAYKRAADTKEETMTGAAEEKYHGKNPMRRQPKQAWRSLAIAVGVPFVLGTLQGFVSSPDSWYAGLKKPSWTPPGWAFGAVWSVIYPLMGLASWLVWTNGGWARQSYPLVLYSVQLALNLFWSTAFFKFHSPLLALADIVLLAVVVVACIFAFKPANQVAANLMQVYLSWVIFAALLNVSIWYMNGSGGAQGGPVIPKEMVHDIPHVHHE